MRRGGAIRPSRVRTALIVSAELALTLMRRGRWLPIAFAADRLDAHGHHEPVVTALASEGADACIGASIDGLGR